MASYNELLALIDAYINRNGVQAITGQILNGVLKAMVDQLGRGYTLMGYAEPTGDPGTPDGPESWFASVPGTYTNYGEIQVAAGELALLSFAPSEGWTKNTIYEGFREVTADIDGNVGTPEVGVSYANGVLSFDFRNMKGNPGEDGDPAGFGSVTASVDDQVGTPSVSVSSSGPDTAKNFAFAFHNLKGETGVTSVVATVDNTSGNPQCSVSLQGGQLTLAFTGLKGAQGNTGSSVDYPFTIVNNLTTDDPTQALSAAMGVELDGKVSQLEADLTDLDEQINGTTGGEESVSPTSSEQGKYVKYADGTFGTANNAYKVRTFAVIGGDSYKVSGRVLSAASGPGGCLYAFFDSTDTFISAGCPAENSVKAWYQQPVTAPANASYIKVGGNTDNDYDASLLHILPPQPGIADIVDELVEDVAELNEEVDGKLDSDIIVEVHSKNLLNTNASDWISGAYINGSGTLVQNSTTTNVDMSGMIPFSQEQGYLTLSYNGGGFTRAWYGNIVFYDSNKEFLSATAYDTDPLIGIVTAAWFSGVAYVRFLIRHVEETISLYQVEVGQTATAFVPYKITRQFDILGLEILNSQMKDGSVGTSKIADGSVTSEKLAEGTSFPASLPAISLCGLPGESKEQASLSDAVLTLTDWPQYIKASNIVSVEAKITDFNTIYLGVGNAHLRGRFIKIDATNLYFGHAATTPEAIDKTSAHGLTIGTFIKAVIIIDGLKTTAIISTIDGAFKDECTLNDVDASRETYGLPYVKADSSTSLTDVKLNANCRKYKCPVWVFGDSMASEFNERWAYYTRYAWGFDYYLDALAGGNSATLFADLELALEHGTPKYLVWMLGANDLLNNNDSGYKNYVEQVETICATRGIELVLLKFPSFPEVDPTTINAWMVARGHRYVDFYRAVGSDNAGNWYAGYMGDDHRHPTELGAMAEASQMCVDFPEIMQN